jgi:hypothetical protein
MDPCASHAGPTATPTPGAKAGGLVSRIEIFRNVANGKSVIVSIKLTFTATSDADPLTVFLGARPGGADLPTPAQTWNLAAGERVMDLRLWLTSDPLDRRVRTWRARRPAVAQ